MVNQLNAVRWKGGWKKADILISKNFQTAFREFWLQDQRQLMQSKAHNAQWQPLQVSQLYYSYTTVGL